jgi:transposase-like protein
MVKKSKRCEGDPCGQGESAAVSYDLPEEWCWQTLRDLRWLVWVVCPRCGTRGSRHHRRAYVSYFWCRKCNRIFSDLTGTPFERINLPLNAWFQAVDLLQCEEELSVTELARAIQVDRKTAFKIKEKLMPLRQNPFIRSIRACIISWKIKNMRGEKHTALKKNVVHRLQIGNLP